MEAGATPSGCPVRDADQDGVVDGEDQCISEKGAAPTGCADGDQDGYLDRADRCPLVPGAAPDGFAQDPGLLFNVLIPANADLQSANVRVVVREVDTGNLLVDTVVLSGNFTSGFSALQGVFLPGCAGKLVNIAIVWRHLVGSNTSPLIRIDDVLIETNPV